jgi:hypothetical protein
MRTERARLVTIICVFHAASAVEEALLKLGASGFSVAPVRGRGEHGPLPRSFIDAKNIAFNVVTSEAVAARILDWADQELLPHYPGIAYCTDVTVASHSRIA